MTSQCRAVSFAKRSRFWPPKSELKQKQNNLVFVVLFHRSFSSIFGVAKHSDPKDRTIYKFDPAYA